MRKHVKIYMEYFGYGEQDYIPSELSGRPASDIHHIFNRGAGGDPTGSKDVIENLMALTREEHERYGERPEYIDFLKERHYKFMERKGVFFKSIKDSLADGRE